MDKIAELLVTYYNEAIEGRDVDQQCERVVIEALEDEGFDVGINEYGQLEI